MKNASFLKRILVIVYDALLLTGVILVGYIPVYGLLQILPAPLSTGFIAETIKILYLVAISFFFYGWFWTHGGQTLGMRAWHLYLIKPDGKFPGWITAAIRYAVALCSWGLVPGVLYAAGIKLWYLTIGLGFTWMLLNPRRLAWHDVLSNTRIVRAPPNAKGTPSAN